MTGTNKQFPQLNSLNCLCAVLQFPAATYKQPELHLTEHIGGQSLTQNS